MWHDERILALKILAATTIEHWLFSRNFWGHMSWWQSWRKAKWWSAAEALCHFITLIDFIFSTRVEFSNNQSRFPTTKARRIWSFFSCITYTSNTPLWTVILLMRMMDWLRGFLCRGDSFEDQSSILCLLCNLQKHQKTSCVKAKGAQSKCVDNFKSNFNQWKSYSPVHHCWWVCEMCINC